MSVRDRFIADTLKRSGDDLMTRQGAHIVSTVTSRTGQMMSSRRVSISAGAGTGILRFTHAAHQRYLDITKPKKGRKRRLHNRFTYHAFTSIGERLMYGLTEEVIAAIREETQNV